MSPAVAPHTFDPGKPTFRTNCFGENIKAPNPCSFGWVIEFFFKLTAFIVWSFGVTEGAFTNGWKVPKEYLRMVAFGAFFNFGCTKVLELLVRCTRAMDDYWEMLQNLLIFGKVCLLGMNCFAITTIMGVFHKTVTGSG